MVLNHMKNNQVASAYIYSQQASVSMGTNRLGTQQRNPFQIFKNSDTSIELHFKNSNGTKVKLYDHVITAIIYHDNRKVILNKLIQITDGDQGTAELIIDAADTKLFATGYYNIVIMVNDSAAYHDRNAQIMFPMEVIGAVSDVTYDLVDITEFPSIGRQSTSGLSKQILGAGEYTHSTGIHTVAIAATGFTGGLEIQAAIESLPQDGDWFTVDNVMQVGGTLIQPSNMPFDQYTGTFGVVFEGNFKWIRFSVDIQQGTIDKITTSV